MPNTISPNMGLIVPGVGTEPGPDWANDINASLGTIDQHSHVAGQGVAITPDAININTDLPMNGFNLNLVKTVNFQAQLSSLPGLTPNLGCIYVAGNELYYNDEAGNVVKITTNGSVNSGAGSITGLPSGTASASYSSGSGTFIWQSATNTAANMDNASVTIREQVASAKGVTLSSPNSLAADYTLVFPAVLPASTKFLCVDSVGNITDVRDVDNVTIQVSADLIQVVPAYAQTINPTGAITMFGGVSAPTGFLLCDGSAVSRTTYSALFAVIGTAYGVGDAATTFNVPDLRGLFPRGVDNGAGNDPNAASRTATNGGNSGDNVGSVQSDTFTSHTHSYQEVDTNSIGVSGNVASLVKGSTAASGGPAAVVTASAASSASGGSETRPKNVYVNFIIKT